MNDDETSGVGPTADLESSFLALGPEIAAIDDGDLVTLNFDLERAVSIALGAAARLQALRPGFASLFFADERDIDRLRTAAYAALYTHLRATEPVARDERFPRVLEEASRLRKELLGTAGLLAELGELSKQHVAEMRSGSGHLDTASVLVALASLFESNWPRLQGKMPVTREQVARARAVGKELFELIGTRRYVPAPVAADDPSRLRVRAFTLLLLIYDRCRRAVVALRWHEGDADTFMPTLYPKRRRRTMALVDDTSETEEDRDGAANDTPPARPALDG